jgi:hypothetical protein
MKNTKQLIDKINDCNLSNEDKNHLIEILNNKTASKTKFVVEFLKIIGISKRVFDAFDIDIGHFIDKFF